MGLLGPNRGSGHRRYSYEPRYYNPEKEERLKRRMRIESKARRRKSPAGLIYFAIILGLAVYVYTKIG